MKYPSLSELSTSRELIDVFKGYNHNLRIGDGEFYDMQNLTSADYPVLSPRPQRGVFLAKGNPIGMIAKDSFCYLDGTKFVINENEDIDLSTYGLDDKTQKTLISMGAYVIIMPDKIYVNTEKPSDCGKIDASIETKGTVKFELCTVEGAKYENTKIQATAPPITDDMKKNPSTIPLWIDTSGSTHILKQYSTSNGEWSAIATTYIKISNEGIGLPFSVHDGVTIKGVKGIEDLKSPAYAVIWAKDDRVGDNEEKISDWIVVKGILNQYTTQNDENDAATTQTDPVTISREMPKMDFIVESENRLWGCRYGPALNGQIVNEIYASKLGDFKNWNCFMDISTDSYVATVGSDGQFTGAITHLGYPIFFKETCMHKIYGNYPANFQIQTTACRGVQKGSSKSLAIVNETLYYKSASGICAYDGSLPVEISSALGDVQYENAVAGVLGNKLYISMENTNETYDDRKYPLFVYDTRKGMWHKEDNTKVTDFCNCRGELYYIDSDNKIKTVKGTGTKDISMVRWMAETGILGTDSPDKKYISRLDIRLSLAVGSRVYIYAQYDSIDAWEQIFAMSGTTLKTFSVPIRPKRCDHLRLRIVGEGEAKIYSICKTIEQGSDI